MPDFVFECVGSRGDIVPLLSIADELVRRGYRCHMLANEGFGSEARRRGIGFTPSTDLQFRRTGAEGHSVEAYLFPAIEGVRAYLRELAAHDPDTLVVNLDRWAASDPCAEAFGLRSIRLHLSPFKIRSLVSPAWPLGAYARGLMGETYRRYTLPALYRGFDTHPKVLARINQVRRSLGLRSVVSAVYPQPHVVAQAALFPEWFAAPAGDWPEMPFLGFPLPASSEPLPARLSTFLERVPEPPLVFTPGTNLDEAGPFFRAAAESCRELGHPAIFLGPFQNVAPHDFGIDGEHAEYVELDRLLEHCALLVHHGGIGTAARALQAGVPQVISPVIFDQFDNAHRLERFGLARVVGRERLDGETLAAAVRSSFDDTELPERLMRCRQSVGRTRAIEACADLLERWARPGTAPAEPTEGSDVQREAGSLLPAALPATPRGIANGRTPLLPTNVHHALLRTVDLRTSSDHDFSRQVAEGLARVRRLLHVPTDLRDSVVEGEFERLRRFLESSRAEVRRRSGDAADTYDDSSPAPDAGGAPLSGAPLHSVHRGHR